MAELKIAKKNVYADVEEEGGTVRRLVAVAGRPIPAAFVDLVDDADVTTEVARTRVATSDVVADIEEFPGTSVSRVVARKGQAVPAEYDDKVGGQLAEEVEHEPDATPGQVRTQAVAGKGEKKEPASGGKTGRARRGE